MSKDHKRWPAWVKYLLFAALGIFALLFVLALYFEITGAETPKTTELPQAKTTEAVKDEGPAPQKETAKAPKILNYEIDRITGAESNEGSVYAHLTVPVTDTNDLKVTLIEIARDANFREKMRGQQIGVRLFTNKKDAMSDASRSNNIATYFKNYDTRFEDFNFIKQ